jgi:phosphoglucosamine mutase
MVIASVSGIRGVFNSDLLLVDVLRYARNFARLDNSRQFLVASDTRQTGVIIKRTVQSAIIQEGADVVDYGVISTPALFRESRMSGRPAVMITASHNAPAWNGLKFIRNGMGITQAEIERIARAKTLPRRIEGGRMMYQKAKYNADILETLEKGAGSGVCAVLDLGGGAAIAHAPAILRYIGCTVHTIDDAPGLFGRTIDPTVDPLERLSKTVVSSSADIGFAFDCDGDRLVIVDNEGNKRGGDFMLTLALRVVLSEQKVPGVAVSVDTTQAIDELLRECGAEVYRTPVGEANVIQGIKAHNLRFGGEGSSGGFIDADFNHCRDAMIASTTLIRGLKRWGKKFCRDAGNYHQTRIRVDIPRSSAVKAIKKLAKEGPDADSLDGVQLRISQTSWVLVRSSGTEDIVRVSAEAKTQKDSDEIAQSYAKKVNQLAA